MKNKFDLNFKLATSVEDQQNVEELFIKISDDCCEHGQSAQFNWSKVQIAEALKKYFCFFATNADDQACAFILFQRLADNIEILAIGTDPMQHRKGFGGKIFNKFAEKLDKEIIFQKNESTNKDSKTGCFLLEVHESNKPAVSFYLSLGFKIDSRRPRYYKDGASAILMSRLRQL